MKESVLKTKSRAFALRIVMMYKYLCEVKKEYVISKQVLRSGTSVGANIAEAFYAQSDADFIAKLYISRKEAGETIYWIELLKDALYLDGGEADSMIADCDELLRLLTSSIKTMKNKQPRHS
ncbi:MAG: four helix bundle protein [Duncaniella sp.]|nr:four helix bundle protein [Duncaniella sp.]MDE6326056.1 four helix bundle protein [Duncaniella sp.]HBI59177.1 four helix bundle protein [Porphyromonadaceae bacterium]